MEMNFCRRCGAILSLENGHVYTCENGHVIFANASPSACLWLLNDKNELLVVVRALNPGKGMLDAPGGFNDGAETFEVSVARELEEEVGLKPTDYTRPQYLLSSLDAYEYKGEAVDVLCGVYYARLIGNPPIKAQDDVAEAHFIAMSDIDPSMIYFDSVREGFLELKSRIDHVSH